MLTKKQLAAIERLIEVAEEEESYRMTQSSDRHNYTDADRKRLEREVKLAEQALAILRQMAGRKLFTVTWRPDGGDEESFFYSGAKEASDRMMDAALRRLAGDDGALVENYVITHEEVPFTALPITQIGR